VFVLSVLAVTAVVIAGSVGYNAHRTQSNGLVAYQGGVSAGTTDAIQTDALNTLMQGLAKLKDDNKKNTDDVNKLNIRMTRLEKKSARDEKERDRKNAVISEKNAKIDKENVRMGIVTEEGLTTSSTKCPVHGSCPINKENERKGADGGGLTPPGYWNSTAISPYIASTWDVVFYTAILVAFVYFCCFLSKCLAHV
jgi:uncharacterized coiled-coil protein SlyX